MRIVHCADLHLDSKMTGLLGNEKAKERRAELLNNFTRLVKYATDHGADAIIIAGDLFDTNKVSATARKAVKAAIEEADNISFFYLRGNHDRDGFLAGTEDVPDNLYTFDDTWTGYDIGKDVTIMGAELCVDNAASLYNSLVLSADRFNIVTLHGQESMARPGDKTVVVALHGLRQKGIDYLALGHIHEYREAPLDERGVYCYPGCLEGRGYDEEGDHGFVVLDIDEDTHRYTRTFVPFALRKVEGVDVDVSDCISNVDIVSRIMETVDFKPSDYIKINMVGDMNVERDDIATEYILSCIEDKAYSVRVKDKTGLRVNYDDYLFEESLKGEFVRLVRSRTDLADEEKAAVIRYGFEAISGGKLDS